VHKDLRRAAQAGGREVLRVEVIAPSPLLAGGLSNFPAIVKFLSDKALFRENDRVRDQQKLAGQDSAELAKAMLSADRFVREESPPLPVDAATRAQPAVRARTCWSRRTALLSLRRLVEMKPIPATGATVADIDPLLADTHAFEELRLLSQLRSRPPH
jgi:hypothetical protein